MARNKASRIEIRNPEPDVFQRRDAAKAALVAAEQAVEQARETRASLRQKLKDLEAVDETASKARRAFETAERDALLFLIEQNSAFMLSIVSHTHAGGDEKVASHYERCLRCALLAQKAGRGTLSGILSFRAIKIVGQITAWDEEDEDDDE